ncbi:MAG: LysM peptidoglycan-binding domain-containing M23 family metallopeptidase [Proteobacteria bacterium]|nr:LysM peptidoglycan-binding domain-containing M23 family metallopeptidase [Pseudomonadota bacterium]
MLITMVFAVAVGCAHQPMAPLNLVGVWHKVASGDSASSLAKRYGANPHAVMELNDLPQNGSLTGRLEIFIPKKGGKPPGTGAPPATSTARRQTRTLAVANRCGDNGRPCIDWPVQGTILSTFGPRSNGHHDGIDISAKRGTPVRASLDGTVLYCGNEISGYGNMIIIRHKNGILTVYAHNDKNLVKEGSRVTRGQVVAQVGNSGNSKEMQLHFEVRRNEKPVNPLLYLKTEENR